MRRYVESICTCLFVIVATHHDKLLDAIQISHDELVNGSRARCREGDNSWRAHVKSVDNNAYSFL